MKKCNRCKIEKELSNFGPQKESPDGHAYTCRECKKNLESERRLKKGLEPRKKRDDSLFSQGLRECLNCNSIKKVEDFSPSVRGDNGLSAYCKECNNKILREKGSNTEYVRKWRKGNESYRQQHVAHQQKRRATKRLLDTGLVSTNFILNLYAEECCYYCEKEIPVKKRTIEHKQPLSKGGLHSPDNLVMACRRCNFSKGAKTEEEFKNV